MVQNRVPGPGLRHWPGKRRQLLETHWLLLDRNNQPWRTYRAQALVIEIADQISDTDLRFTYRRSALAKVWG